MAAVTEYPWKTLEAWSRPTLAAYRAARERLERAVRPAELASALAETVKLPVELRVRSATAREAPTERGVTISLELADASAELVVTVEVGLAMALVGQVLGRAPFFAAPDLGVDAPVRGALAAIVIESARRAGTDLPLRLSQRLPQGTPGLDVAATVLLDGRPYDAGVWIIAHGTSTARQTPAVASLGALEIGLPLVAALSLADPGELARLVPGDAWMPGDGWWIDPGGGGRAALAAPAQDAGVAVDLAHDGQIVLRGETVALPTEASMAESDDTTEQPLHEAVLDAPLVVRVELGSVTMLARDWAQLQPGDVIETGHRIAEPVVLRVAGRVVARGELVRIEGELGVRIRELCTEEDS